MKKKLILVSLLVAGLVVVSASYLAWNELNPDFTCARCHEIRQSHEKWQQSVHADISCTECHGTALSKGLTSVKEKTGMVWSHFNSKKTNEDISLTERQALDMADRCAACHQAEQAAWRSGAHSTTYAAIFENTDHNRMEKPYWDCFRCHGMFYDGDIRSLMSMESEEASEWHIIDRKQAALPAITCLSCHQIHAPRSKSKSYKDLSAEEKETLLGKTVRPSTALYLRAEKRHLPSEHLTRVDMYKRDTILRVSDDPNHWLCMQCHASNGVHQWASSDDKTPVGPYEGMSCLDCHNPHSNKVKNGYRNVHK